MSQTTTPTLNIILGQQETIPIKWLKADGTPAQFPPPVESVTLSVQTMNPTIQPNTLNAVMGPTSASALVTGTQLNSYTLTATSGGISFSTIISVVSTDAVTGEFDDADATATPAPAA